MTAAEILAQFPKLRVLVVGDVCLDRWCRYDPALADPSRETGIPRVAVVSTEVTPGAAGTIAANAASLGAQVAVLGVVGTDGFGYELDQALEARGISSRLLVRNPDIATFTYTKLINSQSGREDLPRLDFVNTTPPPVAAEREILHRLEESAGGFDAILVSDQAETEHGGVVTPPIRAALARIASRYPHTVVWVDSRLRAEHFRGVIIKPNQSEAEAASQRALGRVDYAALRQHLEAPLLVVTFGGEGALVVSPDGSTRVDTLPVEQPVDICGAGDSFSAAAAMALRVTGDPVVAADLGNRAASITIMKPGTGTASPEEMLAAQRC